MFRTGLALVIGAALPGASIAEAGSLDQAMGLPAEPPLDVVLLDIQLAGLSGLECIAPLQRKWPGVQVVVVSSHDDPPSVQAAMARGAVEFVSKTEPASRVVESIRGAIARRAGGDAPPAAAAPRARSLTPRQCEVLDLLNRGHANKLIARQLGLSENTVRRHVQDILAFFDVDSRAEAVFAARQRGLVS